MEQIEQFKTAFLEASDSERKIAFLLIIGILLIFTTVTIIETKILVKVIKYKYNSHKHDKSFEKKKKEYENYSYSDGAWSYEDAKTYSSTGKQFNNHQNSYYNNYSNNYYDKYSNNKQTETKGDNYFESLFADAETIEQATSVYKNLSKVFHPDSQNGSEEKMKALTAAYEKYKKSH